MAVEKKEGEVVESVRAAHGTQREFTKGFSSLKFMSSFTSFGLERHMVNVLFAYYLKSQKLLVFQI